MKIIENPFNIVLQNYSDIQTFSEQGIFLKTLSDNNKIEFLYNRNSLQFYCIVDLKKENAVIKSDFNLYSKTIVKYMATPLIEILFNNLIIHASSVFKNGKLFIFSGKSGAGKSTLADFFLNRNFLLNSDDYLFFNNNNAVFCGSCKKQNQNYAKMEIDRKIIHSKIDKIFFIYIENDSKKNSIMDLNRKKLIKYLFENNYNREFITEYSDFDVLFQKIGFLSGSFESFIFNNANNKHSLKCMESFISENI
jgi:serine kinase of HPr protein (carbohydrate metabolism regulator)